MLKTAKILNNILETPDISLENAIEDFETKHDVSVTVHDMRGIFVHASKGLVWKRLTHRHPYCQKDRPNSKSHENACLKDCAIGVETFAQQANVPFTFDCWKGVKEIVIPVISDENIQLLLYLGPFKGESPHDKKYRKACEELEDLTPERIEELLCSATFLGQGIYSVLNDLRKGKNRIQDRKEVIREFIFRNVHTQISLDDLAREISVSPSRASHLCKEKFGIPFQRLVLNERMARAGNLVLNSNYPLKYIATQVGFKNVFYFHKQFKNFYHTSPGEFKKVNSNNQIQTED